MSKVERILSGTKPMQAFASKRRLMDPNELVLNNQVRFDRLWQSLYLHRSEPELLVEISKLALSRPLSAESLRHLEFFMPEYISLYVSLESSWAMPVIKEILIFVSQFSINTAVIAYSYLRTHLQDLYPEKSNGTSSTLAPSLAAWSKTLADKMVATVTLMCDIERAILLSGCAEEKQIERNFMDKKITHSVFLEDRRVLFKSKAESQATYVEKSTFKGPAYFRRVSTAQANKPPGAGVLTSSLAFADRYIKIKLGHLFVIDGEVNRIVSVVPLWPHLRKNKIVVLNEENEELWPKKTKHFFELIDENDEGRPERLQFQTLNATARKMFIKAITRAITREENLTDLVKQFPETDPKRSLSEEQIARVSYFRDEIELLNSFSIIRHGSEASEMEIKLFESAYLPTKLSDEVLTKLIDVKPARTAPFQDGLGALVTLGVERDIERVGGERKKIVVDELHQKLYLALNSKNLVDGMSSFFSRAKVARPTVLVVEEDAEKLNQMSSKIQSSKVLSKVETEKDEVILLVRKDVENQWRFRNEIIARQWATILKAHWESYDVQINQNRDNQRTLNRPKVVDVKVLLPIGNDAGLEEVVHNAQSLEGLRKKYLKEENQEVTLLDHFKRSFSDDNVLSLKEAQKNFAVTLAGCVLLAYILDLGNPNDYSNLLLLHDGSLTFSNLTECFSSSGSGSMIKLSNDIEELLNFASSLDAEASNALDIFLDSCVTGLLSMRYSATTDTFDNVVAKLIDSVEIVAGSEGYFGGKDHGSKIAKRLSAKLNLESGHEDSVKKFLGVLEKSFLKSGKQLRKRYEATYLWL